MLCEKFGDYCLDLSKLIFGGVILAAIMQLDINIVWLFVVGDGHCRFDGIRRVYFI